MIELGYLSTTWEYASDLVELDVDLCVQLDCLCEPPPPIFLVGPRMDIIWRNETSRLPAFLKAIGAVSSEDRWCRLIDETPDQRLSALVMRTFECGASESLVVAQQPGTGPLRVVSSRRSFVRLGAGSPPVPHHRVLLVWQVGDNKSAHPSSGGRGLSAVELRLVSHIAEGKTVRQASVLMHISYHTARKYLQTIFAKTGARRQAELVALIASDRALPRRPQPVPS